MDVIIFCKTGVTYRFVQVKNLVEKEGVAYGSFFNTYSRRTINGIVDELKAESKVDGLKMEERYGKR